MFTIGGVVNLTTPPPVAFIEKIACGVAVGSPSTHSLENDANAIFVPSGDQLGASSCGPSQPDEPLMLETLSVSKS